MDGKRISQLDYAKLFLIFCVVLGHIAKEAATDSAALSCFQLWIYQFHMPGFIFIAGLVSKRTVRDGKWNRVYPYVLLYLLMATLPYFRDWMVCGNAGVFSVRSIFFNESAAWFAMAMFWWYTAAILTRNIPFPSVMTASVILSVVSGYLRFPGAFFAVRRSVALFPFFCAGCGTDPQKLFLFLRRRSSKIAGAAILAFSLTAAAVFRDRLFFMYDIARSLYSYAETPGIPCAAAGGVYRILFFMTASVLVLAILSVMPRRELPLLCAAGRRTLAVYVFHYYVFLLILCPEPFRAWIRTAPLGHCMFLSAAVVGICSLKPFDWTVQKVMSVFSGRQTHGSE